MRAYTQHMDDFLLDITGLLVWIILTEHQWTTQTTVQQKFVVFYDPIQKALEDRNACLSACNGPTSFLAALMLFSPLLDSGVQNSGEVQREVRMWWLGESQ